MLDRCSPVASGVHRSNPARQRTRIQHQQDGWTSGRYRPILYPFLLYGVPMLRNSSLAETFMRSLIAATLLALLVLPTAASAEVQTITASHTYIMGDNDSRNDARQLCFLEAKRKVLEKAGSFIQTTTEAKNFQLTKDQISSYSAAVLSVEITKEDFGFSNGHNALTLTVKADVDIADVQKRLAAIVADKSLQDRIAGQQQQIQQLEKQVQTLNSRLSVAPVSSSGELRKERNVVFGNIEALENKKMAALERIINERERIKQITENIKRYIVVGMTQAEVEGILGKPFDSDIYRGWYYGELYICFNTPLAPFDYRVAGAGKAPGCQ